jgi:hypothetical protein
MNEALMSSRDLEIRTELPSPQSTHARPKGPQAGRAAMDQSRTQAGSTRDLLYALPRGSGPGPAAANARRGASSTVLLPPPPSSPRLPRFPRLCSPGLTRSGQGERTGGNAPRGAPGTAPQWAHPPSDPPTPHPPPPPLLPGPASPLFLPPHHHHHLPPLRTPPIRRPLPTARHPNNIPSSCWYPPLRSGPNPPPFPQTHTPGPKSRRPLGGRAESASSGPPRRQAAASSSCSRLTRLARSGDAVTANAPCRTSSRGRGRRGGRGWRPC